jgi:hypothetical protein
MIRRSQRHASMETASGLRPDPMCHASVGTHIEAVGRAGLEPATEGL